MFILLSGWNQDTSDLNILQDLQISIFSLYEDSLVHSHKVPQRNQQR